MSFDHEKAEALRILKGIEDGTMGPADSFAVLEDADPALVYLIFKWLRKTYREHPAAEGVFGRLVAINQRYRSITRKVKAGEEDPVVDWFEGTHEYAELGAEAFIDLIVEKLEG